MPNLSEQLKQYRGATGITVKKIHPKGYKVHQVRIGIGGDVLDRSGLCEVARLEAVLENETIMFFEPELPKAGWALSWPGRGKKAYFRIPYMEGIPFVLNDSKTYELRELSVDAENKTITMSTTIGEPQDA